MSVSSRTRRHLQSESNLAVDYADFPESKPFLHADLKSYSHGLEKIYALENVDIRTVRKIDLPKTAPELEDRQSSILDEHSVQLKFNFNSKQLTPFVLKEPIQVLSLSSRVEKILIDQNKSLIGDLLSADKRALSEITGLGFGHLDELQNRLQEHLKGHSLSEVSKIDFASWARTLIGDLDAKKAHVALADYQLSDLVSLSTSEAIDVRRVSGEVRHRWVVEIREKMIEPLRIQRLHEDMQVCAEAFIIPWLEKRLGCGSLLEVQERLLGLSVSQDRARRVLEWMRSIYFDQKFPLSQFLCSNDSHLFASGPSVLKDINRVIQTAKTYFYREDLSYTLPSLARWIALECAKMWIGFEKGFIEKVLRLSRNFRVRKANCGNLIVRLS